MSVNYRRIRMRCYHICNFYLAGIHAGIQSAHTQHELAIKYLASTPFRNLDIDESLNEYGARLDLFHDAKADYINWANNHKTMILLNGGMMSHLLELEAFLKGSNHDIAWASFREEEAALNGALTNIGIVLPEHMYRWSRQVLKFLDDPEVGFTTLTADCTDDITCIEKVGKGVKQNIELTVDHTKDGNVKVYFYHKFELDLMRKLSHLRLM